MKYLRSNNVLKDFAYCGNQASFHYAGPVSEFDEAQEWQDEAMKLYTEYRGLRSEMRVIAQKFLWFMTFETLREHIV